MDRTNFFNTTDIGNGFEYDHLDTTLSRFTSTYPVSYYRVQGDDIMRPDLISYKVYGTVNYWWLLCFVNEIQNPLTDIEVGQLLKIPSQLDIYTFFKKYSKR
jgi:hypothetical protein